MQRNKEEYYNITKNAIIFIDEFDAFYHFELSENVEKM